MSADVLAGWEEARAAVTPWTPGAEPRPDLRLAWESGAAPVVRVKGVEVLRISDVIASEVLAVLKTQGVPVGPVLINVPRRCIEVLVPLGSAATWTPQPHTGCAGTALMRCPAPEITRASGRWVAGRTWTRNPGAGTTSAGALAEAVPEATARWHSALQAQIQGWAEDYPTPGSTREGQQP